MASPPSSGNPIVDTLQAFTTLGADEAVLRFKLEHANASLQSALAEFQAAKPHFAAFPQIMERTTANKNRGQKKVKDLNQGIKSLEEQRQRQLKDLSKLITDAAAPKEPIISKADFVSREEFDKLKAAFSAVQAESSGLRSDVSELKNFRKGEAQTRFSEIAQVQRDVQNVKASSERLQSWKTETDKKFGGLQGELQTVEASYEKLRSWTFAAETKLARLDGVYEKLGILETNNAAVFEWKKEAEPILRETASLSINVKQVVQQQDVVKKQMSDLQSAAKKPLVSRDEHVELEKRQDNFDQEFAGLKKDVGNLKNHAAKSSSSAKENPQASGQIPLVSRNHAEVDFDFKSKVEMLAEEGPGLKKELAELGEHLQTLRAMVGDTSAYGHNDKSSTMSGRLQEVAEGLKVMRDQISRAPGITDGQALLAVADNDSRPTAIATLEAEIRDLAQTLELIKDGVITHVDEQVGGVQTGLSGLETARSSDVQRFNSEVVQLTARLDDVKASLPSKADRTEVDTATEHLKAFSGDLKSFHTELGKLREWSTQVNQHLARESSRAPSPMQQQARQLPQRQSPQLPNGHMSSTSLNGMPQSPHQSHAHGPMGQTVSPQPQLQHVQHQIPYDPNVIANMHSRMDGLSFVFEQLKKRYDNLTTDELVRNMLQQFESVWPHAAKCETVFNQVIQLQRNFQLLDERVHQVACQAEGKAQRAVDGVTALKTLLDNTKQDLSGSGTRGEPSTTSDNIDKMKEELDRLGDLVTKHENGAGKIPELDVLVRNLNDELDEIKKTMADLSGEVEGLKGVIDN